MLHGFPSKVDFVTQPAKELQYQLRSNLMVHYFVQKPDIGIYLETVESSPYLQTKLLH
jgi:hypothetical protein